MDDYAYIVVSDSGDDLPEYFGPFLTARDARTFEDALIARYITDGPPLRASYTWEDTVHVETLQSGDRLP
jgi:hypothetical protein